MGSSTARGAYPYPVGTDPTNVPGDVQALADRIALLDVQYAEGTAATFAGVAAGTHGRIYYVTDTKRFYWDTGSAWVPLGGLDNIVTAKGDLLVATAAGVLAKLTVGADGLVLMADSTQAAGVKWGTVFKNHNQPMHVVSTAVGLKKPKWVITQNMTLRSAWSCVDAGSGAKYQIYVNGSAPTGMTDSPATGTTSVQHDFPDVNVVPGDKVQLNVTNAGSGTADLSVTIDAIWR